MRTVKSERLKKLESELQDLEQWLKLGLVPKKDIEKHKEEIEAVLGKIEEEKSRLQFLKESGEAEEFIAPKRNATRAGFTEMPTIPDIDGGETGGITEGSFNIDDTVENDDSDSYSDDEEKEEGSEETQTDDNDSFFSEKNRWRRGGILDPDADEW